MTTRHESEMQIELILLKESLDGTKTKLAHMQAPLEKFGATDGMIRQLAQSASVTFEQFDLSALRTFDSFKDKASELGWS
jgi:hypothetical protein